MPNDLPFRDALRQELTEAARRKPRIESRSRHVGKALALLVIGVIAVSLLTDYMRSDSASADVLSVAKVGDTITVRLTDLEARPHEILKALSEAGIRATVVEEPVKEFAAGRFVALSSSGVLEPVAAEDGTYSEFRLKDYNSSTTIDLNIGRKANAGEEYVKSFNAYAAGGVLHCSGVFGQKVSSVADKLASVPLTKKWQDPSGTSGTLNSSQNEVADKFIGYAGETGPASMLIVVVPTVEDLPAPPAGVADKC